MLEKISVFIAAIIILPIAILIAYVSLVSIYHSFYMSGLGLLFISIALVLCMWAAIYQIYNRKNGADICEIGKSYRKALFTGNFKEAAGYYRQGILTGFERGSYTKSMNVSAIILVLTGFTLTVLGLL